jgi:hypothetical protein
VLCGYHRSLGCTVSIRVHNNNTNGTRRRGGVRQAGRSRQCSLKSDGGAHRSILRTFAQRIRHQGKASSVRTHEAFWLPGSMLATEPVGANVTLSLVGAAAQWHESHTPRTRDRTKTKPHFEGRAGGLCVAIGVLRGELDDTCGREKPGACRSGLSVAIGVLGGPQGFSRGSRQLSGDAQGVLEGYGRSQGRAGRALRGRFGR